MKKNLIPLFVILFVAFAALGVLAGNRLFPAISPDSSTDSGLPSNSAQSNYLIVQSNAIEAESSELVSAWIMFYHPSAPAHITIVPVYPTENLEVRDRLTRSFSITRNHKLETRFVNLVERTYDLQVDGYILLDETASRYFARLVTQRELNLSGNSPTSPDAIQSVLNNGQTIFSAFCVTLSTIGLKTISETVNWTEILPSHFTTDLSFEVLNLVVAQMESSGIIEDCTVFNNQ